MSVHRTEEIWIKSVDYVNVNFPFVILSYSYMNATAGENQTKVTENLYCFLKLQLHLKKILNKKTVICSSLPLFLKLSLLSLTHKITHKQIPSLFTISKFYFMTFLKMFTFFSKVFLPYFTLHWFIVNQSTV